MVAAAAFGNDQGVGDRDARDGVLRARGERREQKPGDTAEDDNVWSKHARSD